MKFTALALIAMLSSSWCAALDWEYGKGKPRCDMAQYDQAVKDNVGQLLQIPAQGKARQEDKVCHASVWDYIDKLKKDEKAKFLNPGTAAPIASQRQFLVDLTKGFQDIEAQMARVDEAASKVAGAFDVLKNKQKDTAKKTLLETLKALIAKEGQPLLAKTGEKASPDKPLVLGGPLYSSFVEEMFKLSKLELVGRHFPNSSVLASDVLEYVGQSKPSFNLDHMVGLGAANCAYFGKPNVPPLPALCAIDESLAVRARAHFDAVRGAVNQANENVRCKGKAWEHSTNPAHVKECSEVVEGKTVDHNGTVADVEAGLAQAIKEEAAKADEERAKQAPGAFAKSVETEAKKRIDGLTPEQLFDGKIPAEYANLTPDQWKQVKAELGKRIAGDVTAGGNQPVIVVDGKMRTLKAPPAGAKEDDVNKAVLAEADAVAKELLKGNTFGANMKAIVSSILGGSPQGGDVKLPDGNPQISEQKMNEILDTKSSMCSNPVETYNDARENDAKKKAATRSKARQDARDKLERDGGKYREELEAGLKRCDSEFSSEMANLEADRESGFVSVSAPADDPKSYAGRRKASEDRRKACRGKDTDGVKPDGTADPATGNSEWGKYNMKMVALNDAVSRDAASNSQAIEEAERGEAEKKYKGEVGAVYDQVLKQQMSKRIPEIKKEPRKFFNGVYVPSTGDYLVLPRDKDVLDQHVAAYFKARWEPGADSVIAAYEECKAQMKKATGDRKDVEESFDAYVKADFAKYLVKLQGDIRRQNEKAPPVTDLPTENIDGRGVKPVVLPADKKK